MHSLICWTGENAVRYAQVRKATLHRNLGFCEIYFFAKQSRVQHFLDQITQLSFAYESNFDTIAITQVKQLASALARSKGLDEREAASQVFGRLSLNLMRGNALMLASRAPDVDIPRTEVDGVE